MILRFIGGLLLVATVTLVAQLLPDIARYLKMRNM